MKYRFEGIMTLRVGIISANWGAFAHLPAWRAVPGVEVVGICTSRRETAEAAAARCGIERPYWNALDMAADPNIDIVDCGTRPNIREAMVLASLRSGKHVYNAIPFAATLEGRVLCIPPGGAAARSPWSTPTRNGCPHIGSRAKCWTMGIWAVPSAVPACSICHCSTR
jgi:hypothetical protein